MSIHDVDKRGDTRSAPVPNVQDKVPPESRLAHGTFSISLKEEGATDNVRMVIKDGRIQIYRTDGTLLYQGGLRDSDSEAAVDLAKPNSELT